jgi:hypothetical protein
MELAPLPHIEAEPTVPDLNVTASQLNDVTVENLLEGPVDSEKGVQKDPLV